MPIQKRKRCPFCAGLVSKMAQHIQDRHFPLHCSVCLKTMDSHPHMVCSPPVTIPCEGGSFIAATAR